MPRVSPPALRASLAVLGAAALMSGCAIGGPEPVVDKDAVLRLYLDEYRIRPAAIRVRAGRIRIIARNAGRLTHNVKVEEASEEEGDDPLVFGGTRTMQPGEKAPSITLHLAPGRYRLLCTIGGHKNLGQYAELVVVPAGS